MIVLAIIYIANFETQVQMQKFQLSWPYNLKSLLFHQNINVFKYIYTVWRIYVRSQNLFPWALTLFSFLAFFYQKHTQNTLQT